jgi:large subunit ribosomal protein L31
VEASAHGRLATHPFETPGRRPLPEGARPVPLRHVELDMKQGIHPDYKPATVVCSCGNRFETMSTVEEVHVEICSVCHPFYTGKQRLVDTAGRVDRFKKKYEKVGK